VVRYYAADLSVSCGAYSLLLTRRGALWFVNEEETQLKRWILVVSSVVTAIVLFAGSTTRAEAHGVPSPDAGFGLAGHPSVFDSTDALTGKFRTLAAVPCVEPPGTPESDGMAGPYPCKNVDLAAYVPTGLLLGGTAAGNWGWTDPMCGREYAIVGMTQSTTFVDVTIPEAPIVRGIIPAPAGAPGTLWREVKVYNNHAYIVQDLLGSGVQIFDLTRLRLPAPAPPCGPVPQVFDPVPEFQPDAVYRQQGASETVSNVHTITINEATGFAYLNGSNTCGSAPHMIDLKPNPKAPIYVGCAGGDGYTHDAQCVIYNGPDTEHQGKEICVLYNEDTLTVVDVTNKSAPVQLERQGYTGAAYTHQGWFTVDQRYIVSDDEKDEGTTVADGTPTKTLIWDASDLDNLVKISTFTHPNTRTADPADRLICIDHNQYIRGNVVYQSDYACGLRIYSLSNLAGGTLTELAHFDTMPATDISFNIGGDLTGDWANYPYFPSGTVVVSNITEGLFVLQPRLPDSPTAVTLASFRGRQTGRAVTLNWRTETESDILGFHVWRIAKNRRGIVNRALIPAKALGRAGGATYRFVDRNARAGVANTYKLQVVSTSGVRVFKASTTVRVQH
jgi:choice-of-anchor B domain-containing protein